MLTELYIEALLVDEDLADQVWELWNRGVVSDEAASLAWLLLARMPIERFRRLPSDVGLYVGSKTKKPLSPGT